MVLNKSKGNMAFTLFTDSTVYSQLKFALCIISHVEIGLIPLKPTRRYFPPHHVSAQLQLETHCPLRS